MVAQVKIRISTMASTIAHRFSREKIERRR